MQMGKSNLFQLAVMAVSLVAVVVLLWMGWSHVQEEEAAVVAAGTESLDAAHAKVVNLMGSIIVDLNMLADSMELLAYLGDGNVESREALMSRWIEFSSGKTLYDQIRFIDGSGMEIIRVNRTSDGAVAVPSAQLQDKSSRYYFQDSIALEKGAVFVSALDLNKERGRVEEPFKPMLRLGLSVFAADGSKQGIILVNVLAQEILDLVQREVNRPPFAAMMLNSDGFWLLAPNQGDAWSFMFDGGWSFPARYHQVWQQIGLHSDGRWRNSDGMFLHEKVLPMTELVHRIPGLNLAPGQEDFEWVLVAHATPETLSSLRNILILERLPWLVLPLVLLLQSGITFFRRRRTTPLDDSGSAR